MQIKTGGKMGSIKQLMLDSGWKRQERINAGKCYVEWTREGYIVDEDDITKLIKEDLQ